MALFLFSKLKKPEFASRPSVIIGGIALIITLAAAVFAEVHHQRADYAKARATVAKQLDELRQTLEDNVHSNLQLVRGLAALIAAEPDIQPSKFGQIAETLIKQKSQLKVLVAAPDLVIKMVHPLEGHEAVLGVDYTRTEVLREAALKAVRSEEIVLAGPIDLFTGGRGFIGRFPVFTETAAGERNLWGMISAIIDVQRLYRESGFFDPELEIDVAIAGMDADLQDNTIFFGSHTVFKDDPVLDEVNLPSGGWRIAAIPKGGWEAMAHSDDMFHVIVVLAALLVLIPIFVAGRLLDQRQVFILESKQRREEMERLSQRLQLALDTSQIGIWELNLDTQVLTWDERMRELYGMTPDSDTSEYAAWTTALHPDDRKKAEAEFNRSISSGSTYHSEFRVKTPEGTVRWLRAIGAVHKKDNGQRYIVGVNWDVSTDIELKTHLLNAKTNAEHRNRELENARAQMEHNSLHDSLTDLPNRRFLDQHLLHHHSARKPLALLHIDLDRFKQINDTLGHAAGDAMLSHAATVLKANTRDDDFVARIGGDEFVIAIMDRTHEKELSKLAAKIVEEMRNPVPYDGHSCRLGASIGIALADRNIADGGRNLLVNADIALYRAKSNGRNRFEFFSDTLKAEIVRNKRLADDILNGLDRQEFLPYFQPQFDAKTLEIIGVEALARWDHPEEGILTPDAFLKTADELNVVPLIDRTILEQTLWQATRWKSAGINIPKSSVNVSAGRLNDANLFETLEGLDIEPGTLSFELLESIFLDEQCSTITQNFERLRQKGIDIEIDDFGTGYASIVSLTSLRPHRLKIDRQLITPITHSRSQRRLVTSIIDIGHSLGIKVLAEGVETMEHATILRDLECDALQGYAFAAPMSSAKLIEFVRRGAWRKAA
ncbi:MAG: EAL domain-containing protein [Rhodobacteraceae bacterium]|nr:EAL domain-containing protein [Paracoccaceae bacterium]